MTDFNETDHPRAAAGTFTTKAQSDPETALALGYRVPAELQGELDNVLDTRWASRNAEQHFQSSVAAALRNHILEQFPLATRITFTCPDDEPDLAPYVETVWRDGAKLWELDDALDALSVSTQNYARHLRNPHLGDSVLSQEHEDDIERGVFCLDFYPEGPEEGPEEGPNAYPNRD